MNANLVTIAHFSTPTHAHIARARLASRGIAAVLLNENIANINPYHGGGLISVELLVRARDVPQARALLSIHEHPDPPPLPAPEVCPKCGGGHVLRSHNPLIAFYLFLLWFYDPDLGRRRWRCPRCHHSWVTR